MLFNEKLLSDILKIFQVLPLYVQYIINIMGNVFQVKLIFFFLIFF